MGGACGTHGEKNKKNISNALAFVTTTDLARFMSVFSFIHFKVSTVTISTCACTACTVCTACIACIVCTNIRTVTAAPCTAFRCEQFEDWV